MIISVVLHYFHETFFHCQVAYISVVDYTTISCYIYHYAILLLGIKNGNSKSFSILCQNFQCIKPLLKLWVIWFTVYVCMYLSIPSTGKIQHKIHCGCDSMEDGFIFTNANQWQSHLWVWLLHVARCTWHKLVSDLQQFWLLQCSPPIHVKHTATK